MCGKRQPPTRRDCARSWRHRGEGRLLAQRLCLPRETQHRLLGPLEGAWPGTPSSRPGHPFCLYELHLQLPLPGDGHFSNRILTMIPGSRAAAEYCKAPAESRTVGEPGPSRGGEHPAALFQDPFHPVRGDLALGPCVHHSVFSALRGSKVSCALPVPLYLPAEHRLALAQTRICRVCRLCRE